VFYIAQSIFPWSLIGNIFQQETEASVERIRMENVCAALSVLSNIVKSINLRNQSIMPSRMSLMCVAQCEMNIWMTDLFFSESAALSQQFSKCTPSGVGVQAVLIALLLRCSSRPLGKRLVSLPPSLVLYCLTSKQIQLSFRRSSRISTTGEILVSGILAELEDIPAELEEIPGLSAFGVYFFWANRATGICICLNCKCGVRAGSIHGHLKNHFAGKIKLSKMAVMEALAGLPLMNDDEAVAQSHHIIAPYPFLKLYPDDAEIEGKGRAGWHCSYCNFCAVNREYAQSHTREKHAEKMVTGPTSAHLKQGRMQRFFRTGHGSAYFKVDPVLCGVQSGSDFDIFFSSIQQEKEDGGAPKDACGGVGESDWDISPFLSKAGWLGQIHGYSGRQMRERVGQLRKHEASFLRKLPKLAAHYLKSISQAELNSLSPTALEKLNNWKS
jgi:hypothetical protein